MHSYGFTFKSDGAAIAKIIEFDKGGAEATMSPAHYLDVPNATKIFEAGLLNEGECTFTLRMNKTQYATIRSQFEGRAEHTGLVTFPDGGSTDSFPFLWKSVGYAAPDDGPVDVKCTIQINGRPTFTAV